MINFIKSVKSWRVLKGFDSNYRLIYIKSIDMWCVMAVRRTEILRFKPDFEFIEGT